MIDPHDRKPWAIGWFVITPDLKRVWVAEWPDFDFWSVKSWDWGVDEYAGYLREREGAESLGLTNVVWRLMDPRFARAPKATSGTTLFDEMDRRGFYFDRQFWSGDLGATRPLLRDALKTRSTLFVESCRNFRKSFLSCTWDDYRGRQAERGVKEQERPKYKDFCDVARYAEVGETRVWDLSALMPLPPKKRLYNLGMG